MAQQAVLDLKSVLSQTLSPDAATRRAGESVNNAMAAFMSVKWIEMHDWPKGRFVQSICNMWLLSLFG